VTAPAIAVEDHDEPGVAALKRYLRGLWSGFAVDAPVLVFGPG
jgi:hypothetical protein